MAQDYFSGNLAKFAINGANYEGQKGWTVDNPGEERRTDNTADGKYSNRIVSTIDAQITIEGDWDASENMMDDPPSFQPNSILTNLRCFLNGLNSPYWDFPKAIVLRVNNQAQVGDTVKWSVTIGNKGIFTAPAGTFDPIDVEA